MGGHSQGCGAPRATGRAGLPNPVGGRDPKGRPCAWRNTPGAVDGWGLSGGGGLVHQQHCDRGGGDWLLSEGTWLLSGQGASRGCSALLKGESISPGSLVLASGDCVQLATSLLSYVPLDGWFPSQVHAVCSQLRSLALSPGWHLTLSNGAGGRETPRHWQKRGNKPLESCPCSERAAAGAAGRLALASRERARVFTSW